jgi:hypothetical protein
VNTRSVERVDRDTTPDAAARMKGDKLAPGTYDSVLKQAGLKQ